MTGLAGEPQFLRFRCCVEQRSTEAKRNDPVSLAMKDQDRRLDIADPRQRVETVTHQRGSRYERVMVLGDFGDAGEGRFEYQARDLPLRRQGHGNSRSERLAVDHEPVRRDPLATEKIESRGTVSDQA